jgi:hypothetical protein
VDVRKQPKYKPTESYNFFRAFFATRFDGFEGAFVWVSARDAALSM